MVENSREEKVLIFAPVGRDAAITAQFLREAGLPSQICDSFSALTEEMKRGVGMVFLTGEALTPEATFYFTQELAQQPAWSDVPVLVLTSGGGDTPSNADVLAMLSQASNATLIERPVRSATLLSSIKSALRARRRQYDVRDHIAAEARARDALTFSEQRLHIALDAAQLGAWDLDCTTGELTCTEQCKANFGLPAVTDFTYEQLLAAIYPGDRPAMQAAVEEAMRERKDYRAEYRVFWPDGSLHWILANGHAYYTEQGEPRNLVGVTLDVTERKRAETERERLLAREREARTEAEEASRLKDEFLATVSHELRTPLTAILGWANMLKAGDLDGDTIHAAVETIDRNARSQVQLIDDLLDVSRIITGKLRLDVRDVELPKIIEAALGSVRPAAEAKKIELQLHLSKYCDLVSGDAERLQQVVWNLLSNAVKFTPAGGKVEVHTECLETHVQIRVSDTGKGIAREFLPQVFDRFRQADQSSTRVHGGLGLGLSIVCQIVELHGGTVRADSEGEGKGATFQVELPIPAHLRQQKRSSDDTTTDVTNFTSAAEEEDMALLHQVRILVVDDDDDTRHMLEAILRRHGAVVVSAPSADQALKLLEDWRPHVLLSDIGLPEEDGYSLMEKIRASEDDNQDDQKEDIVAIALTAYVREEDKQRALASGFQSHVSKPVEPDELVALIADMAVPRVKQLTQP